MNSAKASRNQRRKQQQGEATRPRRGQRRSSPQKTKAPKQPARGHRPRTARPRLPESLAVAKDRALKHVLSAEDARNQMAVAQQIPGVFHARFETDGQIIDTVPVVSSAARTFDTAYTNGVGFEPLGARNYTVLMFCAPYTLFHGLGEEGDIPKTSKLAGFGRVQVDDVNSTLKMRNMLTRASFGSTMQDVFGSQGQQATNSAFVWASRLDFTFVSQKVGATGCVHLGYLPHSSLVNEEGEESTFTVDDLIKRCSTTVSVTEHCAEFSMHSALQVKAGIMSSSYENYSEIGTSLQGEIVTYAVLNRPYTKFESGANQPFSLVVQSHANASGFARSDDAFAPKQFRGQRLGIQTHSDEYAPLRAKLNSAMGPGVDLRNMPEISHVSSEPALNNSLAKLQSEGGKWLEKAFVALDSWFDANQDVIMEYAWDALTMLPALLVDEPPDDKYYFDADYLRCQLRTSLASLQQFPFLPEVDTVVKLLSSYQQSLGSAKGLVDIDECYPPDRDLNTVSVAGEPQQCAHTRERPDATTRTGAVVTRKNA